MSSGAEVQQGIHMLFDMNVMLFFEEDVSKVARTWFSGPEWDHVLQHVVVVPLSGASDVVGAAAHAKQRKCQQPMTTKFSCMCRSSTVAVLVREKDSVTWPTCRHRNDDRLFQFLRDEEGAQPHDTQLQTKTTKSIKHGCAP